jgi:homocysteine S-methyltransferase
VSKYRDSLPQLGDRLFLTDGGIETVLIFHHGLELTGPEALKVGGSR